MKKLLALSLVLALGSVATEARAATRTIHASICEHNVPRLGSQKLQLYGNQMMPNPGATDPLLVSCPLFRENMNNTNGLTSLKVGVYNTAGTLTCTAYAIKASGAILKSSIKSTTGTSGFEVLDFGSTLNMSEADSTYMIRCSLSNDRGPLTQRLGWIRYTEP